MADDPTTPPEEVNPFASPAVGGQSLAYRRRRTISTNRMLLGILSVPGLMWTLWFFAGFMYVLFDALSLSNFDDAIGYCFGLSCLFMMMLPGLIPVYLLIRSFFPSRHDKLLAKYRS